MCRDQRHSVMNNASGIPRFKREAKVTFVQADFEGILPIEKPAIFL
jgi:hypothetical protein